MIPIESLKSTKSIFWDFDGVIKDSVEVKSDAFEQLFLPFGKVIAKQVRTHHEENGGISRFDKLPIYIGWAAQEFSIELLNEYAEKFSLLVKQKVIDSEWVVGVLDYLKNNYKRQQFFLVTASPQKEIEDIISSLKIKNLFIKIIGSPTKKRDALQKIMVDFSIKPEESIMVGDSISDHEAAVFNKVPFILRKTKLNKDLQNELNCLMVKNYKQ
jgi:phosphoglycolate phosphatase-like HAD superfamily hydrolase